MQNLGWNLNLKLYELWIWGQHDWGTQFLILSNFNFHLKIDSRFSLWKTWLGIIRGYKFTFLSVNFVNSRDTFLFYEITQRIFLSVPVVSTGKRSETSADFGLQGLWQCRLTITEEGFESWESWKQEPRPGCGGQELPWFCDIGCLRKSWSLWYQKHSLL